MTRANALALSILVCMLLAMPCRGHAENAADLSCTIAGGESPTLSCPKLDALDASKDFTVKLAGAAANTTLALKYAATKTGARAKQEDCPLATATGFYSCAKRTTPGNGITLVASPPGAAPAKLDGATKTLTAKNATKPADESASDSGTPSSLPIVSYDRDVQRKLESAVAAGDADLVEGDGYRFSYTSGGKVLVVLNSQAQPLRPIPEVIDETDEIVVAVVDTKDLMQDVTVSISGCNRPPVDARVSGEPAAPQVKGAENAPLELGTPILRYLGRCAGGDSSGPTVTVKTNAASSNAASSSVQIPVNPVYRLAVGLALGADLTTTRTFGVATLPGDTIGTVTETNDRIGLASLLFFGWYPLGRDFRKVAPKYALQRLELFIALDPKSLDQSLIIGGAFNLVTGLDFLVGWRALNKTTELQPGAGLRPGSPFDGAAGSLPTAQVWSTGGLFLGFGVTNALLAKLH
jgi:hypothetical protein